MNPDLVPGRGLTDVATGKGGDCCVRASVDSSRSIPLADRRQRCAAAKFEVLNRPHADRLRFVPRERTAVSQSRSTQNDPRPAREALYGIATGSNLGEHDPDFVSRAEKFARRRARIVLPSRKLSGCDSAVSATPRSLASSVKSRRPAFSLSGRGNRRDCCPMTVPSSMRLPPK